MKISEEITEYLRERKSRQERVVHNRMQYENSQNSLESLKKELEEWEGVFNDNKIKKFNSFIDNLKNIMTENLQAIGASSKTLNEININLVWISAQLSILKIIRIEPEMIINDLKQRLGDIYRKNEKK